MEEKIFGFMEKMYSEIQELRKGQDKLTVGQEKLENDIKTLGNQVAQIENDLKPKIEVALDGYKVVYEKLEIIENKVDKLATTVESHDVKIEVIRGVK